MALYPRYGAQAGLLLRNHHGGLARHPAGLGTDQPGHGRILPLGLYLYDTTEASSWASQLLFRLFDQVSWPLAVPALFTPYLYILL